MNIENITLKTYNHSVILVDMKGNKVAQLGETFKTFDAAMKYFDSISIVSNTVRMLIESKSN